MNNTTKGRVALGAAVLTLIAFGLYAQSPPWGTIWPSSGVDELSAVGTGDLITSSRANTVFSAIRNLETAVGLGSDLLDTPLKTRIANLPGTSGNNVWTGSNSFKIINNTLNAALFTGSDIGAKVNAAVHGAAGCNSIVGSDGFCRVVIPPNASDWIQSVPIVIDRDNTELDCQGAVLRTSNSLNGNPIVINYTNGSGTGVLLHDAPLDAPASNITVRNCTINNSSQASNAAFYGSPASSSGPDVTRGGRVLVWNVNDVVISNIFVNNSYGPAIQVLHSSGIVRDVRVTTTRIPYSTANAAGLWTRGSGDFNAGSIGVPIRVSGVKITASAHVGIYAEEGSTLSDVSVTNTRSSCLLIAGSWTTLDGFNFVDCVNDSTANFGAVDDFLLAGLLDRSNLIVRNGSIKKTGGNGVRLASATTCKSVDVSNIDVECFGYEHPNAVGIRVGGVGQDYTNVNVSDNNIISSGCSSSSLAEPLGIVVESASGPALVSNNNIGPLDVDTGNSGQGIFVHGKGMTVVGNSIHGVDLEGIVVSDSEHTIVASNNVTDVGLAAVKVHATAGGESQDVAVVANKFSDVCGGS